MDSTTLEIACRASGMLPSAVEDAVRRLEGHFTAQADPSPEMLNQQLLRLRETAPHLFPQQAQVDASGVPAGIPPEVWRGLSPSTRLAWAREHGLMPVVQRRPKPLTLTSEQASQLAQMSPTARLAAYRQLQAEQQQG
jgi:hypothetical protein